MPIGAYSMVISYFKKMDSLQIKRFVYSSPAFIVPSVVNLISLITFTRLLSLADYGKLSLAFITIEFLQGIVFQWVKLGMMRFYKNETGNSNDYIAISVKFNFVAAGFLIFISLAILIANKIWLLDDSFFYILILFGTISRGVHYFILDYLRISENNLKKYTLFALLSNIAFYIPGNCYVLFEKHAEISSILIFQIGTSIGFYLFYLFPFYRNIVSSLRVSSKREKYFKFLHYGAPLILVFIASSMFIRIDRYILDYTVDLTQLGAYSASFSLANLAIGSFFTILTLPTYPEIIKALNKGNDKEAKQIFFTNGNFILAISLPIIFICLTFNSWLCHVFFGEKALQVQKIFPFVLIATFFYNLKVHYFDQTYQFAKRTKAFMLVNLSVGIMHLILGFLLSKEFGSKGIAISAISLNLIGIVFTYFYCKDTFEIRFNKLLLATAGVAFFLLLLFTLI